MWSESAFVEFAQPRNQVGDASPTKVPLRPSVEESLFLEENKVQEPYPLPSHGNNVGIRVLGILVVGLTDNYSKE
jgi:hypothetical protein